jgi:hypothetical protein
MLYCYILRLLRYIVCCVGGVDFLCLQSYTDFYCLL